jgi:hypothetical protein
MVMSEDREKGLHSALKAVLSVARKRGPSLGEVSEAAADELLQCKAYDSEHAPIAINEIEVAVNAREQLVG